MSEEQLERLLHRVQKPGRYVGGEWNVIAKTADTVQTSMALVYPDVYEVGMACPAVHLTYDVVNRDSRFACERVFLPWVDMAAEIRREGRSLFSLGTRRPLRGFDVIGFFLDSELRYTNVLEALDLAGVPISTEGRNDAGPIVLAFGPCAANPEPLAAYIDLFLLGEVEELLPEVLESLVRSNQSKEQESSWLKQAARIPGVYVPSGYTASYAADGTLVAVEPGNGMPGMVHRRRLEVLGAAPKSPVVPYLEVAGSDGVVEVQRGCGAGCVACATRLPCPLVRLRPVAEIVEAVDGLVRNCGYQEISLESSGFLDVAHLEEAARGVRARHSVEDLALLAPRLTLEGRSIAVAEMLGDAAKKRGYPLDLVAGTERLRQEVGFPLPHATLMEGLQSLFERGWNGVRCSFSLGLPTETMEDVQEIVGLVVEMQRLGHRILGKKPRVRVAVSIFTPRPHTTQQRAALESLENIREKLDFLRQGLRKAGAPIPASDPEPTALQAALARGDRRLGAVVQRAWQLGCSFDSWSQRFDQAKWLRAFEECDLSPEFYAQRARAEDEVLPWSHLDFSPQHRDSHAAAGIIDRPAASPA